MRDQWQVLVVPFLILLPLRSLGGEERLPEFGQVRQLVEQGLAEMGRDRRDLITRDEVETLLASVAGIGWEVADAQEIVSLTLPDQHPVVMMLRSKRGQPFMRKVAGYKLIFDRLERIAGEPGGQRLLQDLLKLPDGPRYARHQTAAGVPDLVDLLPKGRNGKTRRVKDYERPTGRLYTAADVLARLEQSYALAR